MALYALISPGGAPGVTTTALALALSWPGRVVLAECDPAGGSILSGLFSGHLPGSGGLLGLAFAASDGAASLRDALTAQATALDDSGERVFLPGLTDPRQAASLAAAWPAIGRELAEADRDVIADCGRADPGERLPAGMLARAAFVILVLRPTLRQVAAARPRVDVVADILGGTSRLGVLVVSGGGYRPGEIASALRVPVLGAIRRDDRTAALLADGIGRRDGLAGRVLLRDARAVARSILAASGAGRLQPGSGGGRALPVRGVADGGAR